MVWYAFGTAGDIDIADIHPTPEQIKKFIVEAEQLEQKSAISNSENTIQKMEFFTPFIIQAAAFTNHFSDSTSVEGAGTALFIIQQNRCATIEEIISEFKQWSDDKAKRFSKTAIISAINELEQAGFIQETFCGYQLSNN